MRDSANRRRAGEGGRAARRRPRQRPAGDSLSAWNRFPGVVRSVEIDGVMALVEIEAGPHRVAAAITRDAVEELALGRPGAAAAAVKATSVMVERRERLAILALALTALAGCGSDDDDREPGADALVVSAASSIEGPHRLLE